MGSSVSTPAAPANPHPQGQQGGAPPPGCPMHANNQSPNSATSRSDELNPLNNMPQLAQAMSPGQKTFLPLERTMSTIPKAATADPAAKPSACPVASGSGAAATATKSEPGAWEYPSPQQFYNALVRKGWETPEESIEVMVDIHNYLNESAWQQVRMWEEKHVGGDRSSLASFTGRPKDLSPKARYHLFLGAILPSHYGFVRPFDRHDWTVHRPVPRTADSAYTSASSSQAFTSHRYVIDYYSLPDDADGNPVFSLDVRPAIDTPAAVVERVSHWWKLKQEAWGGASSSATAVPGMRVQEEK